MSPKLTFIPSQRNVQFRMQDDECLVFTHIPKAAGTTLDRLLRGVGLVKQWPVKRAFGTVYHQFLGEGKRESVRDVEEWDEESRAKLRILIGHVPCGVHELLGLRPRYITLLREPVSRTVSHFKMGAGRGGWENTTSLHDVVAGGGIVSDVQVRMLAGIQSAEEAVTEEALEQALQNLEEKYFLVGFSDTFNEFTSALLGFMDAPNALLGAEHRSRLELPEELESQIRKAALEYNQFDSQLYEKARSIADRKIRELAGDTTGDKGLVENVSTLLASSSIKINNSEYTLITPEQFAPVMKNLAGKGVQLEGVPAQRAGWQAN